MSPSPILILDNQEPVRLLLTKSLEGAGHSVTALPFPEDLGNLLQEHSPSLLVLEDTELKRPLSDLNDFLRLNHERLPYILISSAPEISRAIEAIRGGACDYLPKPIDMPQLLKKVSSALESRKKESALLDRRRQFKTGKGLTFYKLKSPAMERVYDQASQVAMSPDTTVLISGESGTGKEIIARLIHDLSPRHEREFMELNCASIPSELLESELFGHEAGAFTDARESKKGLFEIANGGSIFLDEIGEMSLNLQVKLLRFLELRSFRRVGGTKDIEVNVRIISATNQDLKERVEEKRFRSDLYYRLNVIPISLLPLRERKEDILPLFRFFLMDFMKRYNRDPRDLDEVSSRILLEYAWPGNVRELRNAAERFVLGMSGQTPPKGQLDGVDDNGTVDLQGQVAAFE
ncbi:MAG: sigma-54 dependent transcriptional regulator, partial [Candidatus Krumholzibacteria bacterium]|nr:sigma-54 dependent transcriptional regulator [Candidatus Krumholzibacteria bacterium]